MPGRLRERDQGTAGGLCAADPVSGKFLGERSGVEPGEPDLQPDRVVRAASGLAANGDPAELEVLAVCDGGRAESSGGQDDDQTGRARARACLVAVFMGEDFEPVAQLQCS